jgi:hypothetical protein
LTTESVDKQSRRKFVGKILKFGAIAGATQLLFGQLQDKTHIVPRVYAASGDVITVDGTFTGESTTQLTSTVSGAATFLGQNDSGGYGLTGKTGWAGEPGTGEWPVGVLGEMTPTSGQGTGVQGFAHSPDAEAIDGTNDAVSGYAIGVGGWAKSLDGFGIYGMAYTASGSGTGVQGRTRSPDGIGVGGMARVSGDIVDLEDVRWSGAGVGVRGTSWYAEGIGVQGLGKAVSGYTRGMSGKVYSPDGRGVRGYATGVSGDITSATSGSARGVDGMSDWPDGIGVMGQGMAVSGYSRGVYGKVYSPDGRAARGYATGISGDITSATSGSAIGVDGWTDWPDGKGVRGYAFAVSGYGRGVYGQSDSPDGRGVYGYASSLTGHTRGVFGSVESPDGRGVFGYNAATSGYSRGVYGQVGTSPDGMGVFGYHGAPSGYGVGVVGWSDAYDGNGVAGVQTADSPGSWGVYGETRSRQGGIGVYGVGKLSGAAAPFSGFNAGVMGTTWATGGVGTQGNARANGAWGVLGRAGTPGAIPLVAQAASGQTAALQQWIKDNIGTLNVIDKDGKLGIGTTAPTTYLHIVNATTAPTTVTLDKFSTTGNDNDFAFRRARNTKAAPTAVATSDILASYSMLGYDGAKFVAGAGIDVLAEATWTAAIHKAYIRYLTNPGTTATSVPLERMRITSAGNVGIGTSAPTSRLHVTSDSTTAGLTGVTIDIPGITGSRRVQVGPANSAGPGFRYLRIPN